jgi:hypothetical protein
LKLGGGNLLKQMRIPDDGIAVLFEPIKDPSAAVNLAREGKIQIEDVVLDTLDQEDTTFKHTVSVSVKNKTDEGLSMNIPKGQIFENRLADSISQNLAAADDYQNIRVEARQRVGVKIGAHCVNQDLQPPQDVLGNITIFELTDKNFVSQNQLWKIIEQARNKILND